MDAVQWVQAILGNESVRKLTQVNKLIVVDMREGNELGLIRRILLLVSSNSTTVLPAQA